MPETTAPPAVNWQWWPAAIVFVAALPAAAVTLYDVQKGAALAVGLLPAAALGIAAPRRRRIALLTSGFLLGIPMALGSAVSSTPAAAVIGIAAFCIAAVALWIRGANTRIGALLSTLVIPMVGVGLSYPDTSTAVTLTTLFFAGSVLVWLLSLAVPDGVSGPQPAQAVPTSLTYGYLLAAVAAVTAIVGFALDLDHVGWACAAALMVMRPDPHVQVARTAGRFGSVLIGAAAAGGIVHLDPPAPIYAGVFTILIASAAATHGSRLYILPLFTTFFVIVLLSYADPAQATSRFFERVGETLLGLLVALIIGIALPAAARWFRGRPGQRRPPHATPRRS
ncbi:FUSC family protein [Gordonia sp. NPDC058843]|uniref:FUSC family protein n=1 Tax=Gordonia sp. NPDC058843 TaxID=3346648 RepID=UPI0036A9D95E